MKTSILLLGIMLFFIGCCQITVKNTSGTETGKYEYIENFETPIYFEPAESIDNGSFISYGSNGWTSYIEKTHEEYSVSSNWIWHQIPESYTGNFAIQGQTSRSELGTLWLCKSYRVSTNTVYDISVKARTKHTQSGSPTGPELVIFNGELETPSIENPNKLSSVFFKWDRPYYSDWTLLDTKIFTNSRYITVALKVRDSWNSYSVSHQFDDLKIIRITSN